ncbi:MAG TPA: MAPEG family protein [Xanthobacteraceae bacterium]
MTTELLMLALSVVLGFVHIIASTIATTHQYGTQWNLSARDDPMPPLQPIAGRLSRAQHNFLETFPLFVAVVLMADAANRHGALAVWGSQIYFYARVLYLPIYAAGVPVLRTLVWTVAAVGIVMVLAALFEY